jgi:hypothetical protein
LRCHDKIVWQMKNLPLLGAYSFRSRCTVILPLHGEQELLSFVTPPTLVHVSTKNSAQFGVQVNNTAFYKQESVHELVANWHGDVSQRKNKYVSRLKY